MQLPLFSPAEVPTLTQPLLFRYTKLQMIKHDRTGGFDRWGEEYWAEPEWRLEKEQAISFMHFLKEHCADFCGQFEIALVPDDYPRSCQPWHKKDKNYLKPIEIIYPLKNVG